MAQSTNHFPSTPSSTTGKKYSLASYQPLNSSPLASSPSRPDDVDSPLSARRRLQFKSRTPSTPVPSSSRVRERGVGSSGGSVFRDRGVPPPLDPQKTLLREKFRARCFERAAKARERAIQGRRSFGEPSSDGFDEVMDAEDDVEDDEDIMQDELFRRIVQHANRRTRHSYRLSYADEVGSSFDPNLENVEEWESELITPGPTSSQQAVGRSLDEEELTPEDLDDEELEAYAEECVRRAALADFEDLPEEELFSLSDVEDLAHPSSLHDALDDDIEMD
ncbi:hypothetical protein H0H92_005749 [Tricholoma furcatifolium]|nr:hypothetical protein H0H92_005749 [Tricholoma furcatifolium]